MRSLFARASQVFSGLRLRLLCLIVLASAPLVVWIIHASSEERRRALANWGQQTDKLLPTTLREEEEVIGETRQLLLAISESSAVRSFSAPRCKKWLDELLTNYPRYANLGVITTNGDLLASAVPEAGLESQANRVFVHRVLETRAFAVGNFPSTAGARSAPTVRFGYPVLDRSDLVLAVVFAELGPHWFDRFGPELRAQLPEGASWSKIDRRGTALAHYPNSAEWTGHALPDLTLVTAMFRQTNGVLQAADLGGIPMLYAYYSIPSLLTTAETRGVLAIPKRLLFADADRVLRINLSWLALAAGLAVALGWVGSNLLILRPVKALVHSTTRLAAGDLSARTGLRHSRDELGQLTLAFDQMAQSLEQREGERQRASQKLQVLSQRLVEVQESERRNIARELHDEIGQSLTAAEMNLQAALELPGAAAALSRRLQESIQAVEHVLEQVHDLSLNLRPSMLDDLGLEPALRWYTNRQAALIGLQAEFRAEPLNERLDPMIETECFRVAQEALTNVVRHARASAVKVELTNRNGRLHLRVRDDGIGFNVSGLRDKAVRGASLGLLSMEERAALAGGGLEFNSAPGQGTEIHAWFPLRWNNAPAYDNP